MPKNSGVRNRKAAQSTMRTVLIDGAAGSTVQDVLAQRQHWCRGLRPMMSVAPEALGREQLVPALHLCLDRL